MRLINIWRHTKIESFNTNNCYHKSYYHTVYVALFYMEWKILEWRHDTLALHEDNEKSK
jgi:hypothetical protein